MKMLSKYLVTSIKQHFLSMFVTQKQWKNWSASWSFFFILANGRSGTNFLANLLNKVQGANVFHEPVPDDFYAYIRALHNPGKAEKYIDGFRKKEIYLRMHHIPKGIYGEVNGVLRCHADAIRKVFPDVTLIHLVRDGRDVVRSTMSRNTMTIKNPFSMKIYPDRLDPWLARWNEMDRFARICWLWQAENKRLRITIGKTVHFERILSSYNYFSSEILEPCGLQIGKKDWEVAVAAPRNTTREFSMPKWDEWTPEQKKTFREICGDEMEKCGYLIGD